MMLCSDCDNSCSSYGVCWGRRGGNGCVFVVFFLENFSIIHLKEELFCWFFWVQFFMLWYFEIVCQSSLHHLSWPSDLAQFVVRLQWLCACAFSFPRFSMSTNTQTNTTPSSDIWLDRCSIIVDWWSTPTLFGMSLMAKVAWNPDCNWIVRCEPPIMGWGHTWLHLFYPPLCPICTSPPPLKPCSLSFDFWRINGWRNRLHVKSCWV